MLRSNLITRFSAVSLRVKPSYTTNIFNANSSSNEFKVKC